MSYLERWEVWLVAILFVLILIYIWTRYWSDGSDTRTCTPVITDTMTRVEEVLTVDDLSRPSGALVVRQNTVTFTEKERRKRERQSNGERRCLEVLEGIYGKGKLQVQVRPDELRNPKTGRNLELDIYHPEKKLGWEYDGRQHAEVVPRFHPKGQEDLDAQQRRDALKDELCKKAGIRLTRIPHTVKMNDIESYIISNLPISDREIVLRR